jgi:hypothetical protein
MKLTLNLLFEINFFFFEKQTKMYLVQSQEQSSTYWLRIDFEIEIYANRPLVHLVKRLHLALHSMLNIM